MRKTNKNEKVSALKDFYSRERRVPGYNEMLKLFNYKSKNAVYGLLRRLESEGYISIKSRKISLSGRITGQVRLLGAIQAGFPSPAEEELLDTISLDEFLIDKPDATFMLKVSGDSMINAGIHPGDLVLIERGCQPKNNDIVIANVDGEWTIKYYFRDGKNVRLEPANSKYQTIRPKDSLEIAGVVKTVIRKY